MKWLLTLVCVNGLCGGMLYPLLVLGADRPFSRMLETALLVTGAGALYLLVRYRASL